MYGERNNRGGGFGGPDNPPVNTGDEVDVHIEAVGEKGDGIAKIKGFVLFVPDTREGEDCRVKITRVLRKVGFADKIGEAQGPVESSSESPSESSRDVQPGMGAAQAPAEPEIQYEDTEDFGEEEQKE